MRNEYDFLASVTNRFRSLEILVGCEESQEVTKALREIGHNAKSCDVQECSGGMPEHHYQMDVFQAIRMKKWDLIILHPPCTKIAVSGNRWYGIGQARHNERTEAVKWTQKLWDEAIKVCGAVALENPVGVLNKMGDFPKPNYIQPWQFGHGETKKTGFWLYGLEALKPTNIVEGREQRIWKMPPSEDRGKLRSKTYPGIAKAIAEQWAGNGNIYKGFSNAINEALTIPVIAKSFTCDVCFNETDNKKDEENYRYCNSCKKL